MDPRRQHARQGRDGGSGSQFHWSCRLHDPRPQRVGVHLPVRGGPGRDVLVPLAPALPRAGQTRTSRRARRIAEGPADDVVDVPALVHLYQGQRTVKGHDGDLAVEVARRSTVRVRVINTDNGPMPVWVSGASYRVLAVDGTDVNEPTPVSDESIRVTAGGRADLEIVMPDDGSGVRVELGGSAAVVLGGALPPSSTRTPEPSSGC